MTSDRKPRSKRTIIWVLTIPGYIQTYDDHLRGGHFHAWDTTGCVYTVSVWNIHGVEREEWEGTNWDIDLEQNFVTA